MTSLAHATEDELRGLTDGETSPHRRRALEMHLAGCMLCSTRYADLAREEADVRAILRLLAPRRAALDVDAIIRRASHRRTLHPALIAAAATLVLAAVAGATVGRPWVGVVANAAWHRLRPSEHGMGQRPAARPEQAAVGFVPGTHADIVFEAPQRHGIVHVRIEDVPELSVRATAPVTYRMRADAVLVINAGSDASYDVVIPATAPRVRVSVGGRVILEKRGREIAAGVPPDSTGAYVLDLR